MFSNNNPLIHTKYGQVQGFLYKTKGNKDIEIYLGVPYAKANRFEKPKEYDSWNNIRKAYSFPKQCPPITESLIEDDVGEDCLGLNIIKPIEKSESSNGYPILVFIHGGGFIGGKSSGYGYKSFSEYFASYGIMVITVQYRLGFLGFLSTGDEYLPGNLGLWDLAFSLKFIRDLALKNGGNPDEITLFGHSAGAAAAHALTLSPYTSGLFKRVIQSSGSIFAEWAYNEQVVDNTYEFAEALGCKKSMSSVEIVEILKTKSLNEMYDAVRKMNIYKPNMRQFIFNPRYDRNFFKEPLEELASKNTKIDVMIGITEKEWSKIVNKEYNFYNSAGIKDEYKTNFTSERFVEYINDIIIEKINIERDYQMKLLRNALIEQFVTNNHEQNLVNVVDIVSDLMFVLPPIEQIQLRNKLGYKTYLFYEIYQRKPLPEENVLVPGATHSNELYFILDDERGFYEFDENDNIFKRNLLQGFRSFILTGLPKSDDIEWPDTNNGFKHVELNPGPIIKDEFEKERMTFWLKHLPEKIGVDILRQSRLPFAQKY